MKAVVCERYGPPEVLHFKEVEKPVPRRHEVLIRTHASTVTSADWRVRSLTVPTGFALLMRLVMGVRGPRQPILGSELSGVVESVGAEVTAFKAGDPVFAFSDAAMGCHAEYKCISHDGALALKPANLSHGEAAALSFGGTTALHFLRKAGLRTGERVLVNGASGAVGSAVVQLARHFGADVTGVCSGANADWVRALGARQVIDYRQEDFTRRGDRYDLIVDTAGTAPYSRCAGVLNDGGRLLMVLGGLPDMLLGSWAALRSGKKLIAGSAAGRAEDLRFLAGLAEAGEFRPVIDRSYPFEKIVDAHRYVDTGRKKGNVVITWC